LRVFPVNIAAKGETPNKSPVAKIKIQEKGSQQKRREP
jgi:hypothetical protein